MMKRFFEWLWDSTFLCLLILILAVKLFPLICLFTWLVNLLAPFMGAFFLE